jgi:hypothetical protein
VVAIGRHAEVEEANDPMLQVEMAAMVNAKELVLLTFESIVNKGLLKRRQILTMDFLRKDPPHQVASQ